VLAELRDHEFFDSLGALFGRHRFGRRTPDGKQGVAVDLHRILLQKP